MKKALLILMAGIVVGGLTWGGIVINHRMTCSGFEVDYLNSFTAMRSATSLRSMADANPKLRKAADLIDKNANDAMERAGLTLATQCGTRALDTAFRKATIEAGL